MKPHNKQAKLQRRREAFKHIGSDPRGLGKTKGLQGYKMPGSVNK